MPRNNGIYTPPPSNWSPAVDGNPATPDDWNNLLADISAALTQSVSKDGQTSMSGALPMGNQRIINLGAATANTDALRRAAIAKGADIASAASITIPNEGTLFTITGTTGISAVSMPYDGKFAFLRFEGALTLTNSASLILPGGRNYTTKAGDILLFIAIGGSNVQVFAGGAGYSFEIGDFLDTVRPMDSTWLRRNGAAYPISSYPDLAALLPPLPPQVLFSKKSTGTTSQLGKFAYDGSARYVCGGAPGAVLVSDDAGDTWQQKTTGVPSSGSFVRAAYGDGKFCLAGVNTMNIIYSDDGDTWVERSISATPMFTKGIAFGNGVWALVGNTNTNVPVIKTSFDLDSWSDKPLSGNGTIESPVFFNDVFFAADVLNNEIIKSIDSGSTWTRQTPSPPTTEIRALAVANGRLFSIPSGGTKIFSSPDGAAWTSHEMGISVADKNSIEYMDGRYYVFGATTFAHSSDLLNWVSSPIGDDIGGASHCMLAEDGEILLSGSGGYIAKVEYIPVGSFAVPNDNPTTGWIKAL